MVELFTNLRYAEFNKSEFYEINKKLQVDKYGKEI